jgi:hypothetical protein
VEKTDMNIPNAPRRFARVLLLVLACAALGACCFHGHHHHCHVAVRHCR